MTIRRLLLCLLFWGTLSAVQSQDLHYTLYNMAPLKINPALTGSFYGSVRVGGIYRDQWASFLDEQYRTPSFYVDAPIIRGFRDQDWVGVGMIFVSDRAGLGDLRTSGALFSGSYHLGLDKDASQVLTLGVQAGSLQRKLEGLNLLFADEIGTELGGGGLGQGSGMDRSQLENAEASYLDINIGLMYKMKTRDNQELELGVAAAHITQSDYSLLGGGGSQVPGGGNDVPDENKRPMTLLAHGRYKTPIDDTWSVEPSFLAQSTSGGKSELILQGMAGYQLNETILLQAGLGYRVGDSAQILMGATVDESLKVALSYDLNVSPLNTASNYRGGFELAAYYIIKIYKQPEIKPAILCPKL